MRTRYGISRAANETLVRRLALQTCTNVKFITGTVQGFETVPSDGQAISGVRYKFGADKNTSLIQGSTLVIGKFFTMWSILYITPKQRLHWSKPSRYPLASTLPVFVSVC
jgi:hypothetical protein